MFTRSLKCLGISLVLVGISGRTTAETRPELMYSNPLGGRQDTSTVVEVVGKALEGAYSVWFDCNEIVAEVKEVGRIESRESGQIANKDLASPNTHRVVLNISANNAARIGVHHFRLVTPRGFTNLLSFRVGSEVLVTEVDKPHFDPREAQDIDKLPAVINGRISRKGEVDYYSFRTLKGQRLLFEVFTADKTFDSQLVLFDPAGSWFDRSQVIRLASDDEIVSFPGFTNWPRLTYSFDKDGRYLVQVGAFLGDGGDDFSYQLRIVPQNGVEGNQNVQSRGQAEAHPESLQWQERGFNRNVGKDRIRAVSTRTIGTTSSLGEPSTGAKSNEAGRLAMLRIPQDAKNTTLSTLVQDRRPSPNPESDDIEAARQETVLPVLFEGTIERPGQIDRFKIKVQKGQQLAFEIETPDARPPTFNPLLSVFDAKGLELFTNLYGKIGGDGDDWLKTIESKTLFTFAQSGEVVVQVRDITSRYGDSHFVYRLLIRPQIPHIGKLELVGDGLSLFPGQAKQLVALVDYEEGFDGQIAVTAEGLPHGLEVYPGSEFQADRPPPLDEGEKERFVPKPHKIVLIVVADRETQTMTQPRFVRVTARPILNGNIGAPLFVKQLPIMVIKPCNVK